MDPEATVTGLSGKVLDEVAVEAVLTGAVLVVDVDDGGGVVVVVAVAIISDAERNEYSHNVSI